MILPRRGRQGHAHARPPRLAAGLRLLLGPAAETTRGLLLAAAGLAAGGAPVVMRHLDPPTCWAKARGERVDWIVLDAAQASAAGRPAETGERLGGVLVVADQDASPRAGSGPGP